MGGLEGSNDGTLGVAIHFCVLEYKLWCMSVLLCQSQRSIGLVELFMQASLEIGKLCVRSEARQNFWVNWEMQCKRAGRRAEESCFDPDGRTSFVACQATVCCLGAWGSEQKGSQKGSVLPTKSAARDPP